MRTLTSVASATRIPAQVGLSLTDVGSTTIGVFSFNDISAMEPLKWEVPFGGGLATAMVQRLTLSTSPGWFFQYRKRLPGAEARLTVNANSDVFQPFRGVVRGVETDPKDPNLYTLVMADRLLDADPLVPEIALTDSWNTPHLEDLQSGYPLYYGQTVRPFYFAAVTSDCSVLLGPRNVSNANHTGSLFFWDPGLNPSSRQTIVLINSGGNFILRSWDQQSGASNLSSGPGLYVIGAAVPALISPRIRPSPNDLFQWGALQSSGSNISSADQSLRTLISYVGNYIQVGSNPPDPHLFLKQEFRSRLPDILSVPFIYLDVPTYVSSAGGGAINWKFSFIDGFGSSTAVGSFTIPASNGIPLSFTGSNTADCSNISIFGQNGGSSTLVLVADSGGNLLSGFSVRMIVAALLSASHFKRYSIFAPQVSSADVAISTNPLAILDDVLSHYTSTPYQQAASSGAQANLTSWQFNVLFHERQKQSAILADFCKQTGTYAWQGDSGALSYRAYAESSVATNSVAATINTSDMLGFQLLTSPIGTTMFNQQGFSEFRLEWNFDFQLNKYQSVSVANKLNNALCNSAYASGAQKTLIIQSKYIMDSDTASYALGHAVRMGGNPQDYCIVDLPARFFGIEISDILQLSHPAIGSNWLGQVTKVQADYRNGTVQVYAAQLVGTAGT